MDLAELCAHLASASSLPAVEVAGALLRFCYQRHRDGSWVDREDSPERAHDVVQDFDGWLRDHVSFAAGRPVHHRLAPDALRLLSAMLGEAPADVEPADVAIALAHVLDDHYGERYAEHYRLSGTLPIKEGVVFPVQYPDLPVIVEGDLNAPPWALPRPRYWTKHLRVCDTVPPDFTLELDFDHADVLGGLDFRSYRMATLHPNSALSEFGPFDGPSVFPVVPADMARQRDVLGRLLATASSGQAEIVVVPELAVDATASAEVARQAIAGGALLVVPGSYHVERGDARVNACDLFVIDGEMPALRHEKFHPVEAPIREDLTRTAPTIRCLAGGGWQIAVCVCRDLLDSRVVDAMIMLGCNLVLVPAMSDDLDVFRGAVESLVYAGQAVVVVANNPMLWDVPGRATTIAPRIGFGHPSPGPMTLVTATSSAAGVGWIDLVAGHARFVPGRDIGSG